MEGQNEEDEGEEAPVDTGDANATEEVNLQGPVYTSSVVVSDPGSSVSSTGLDPAQLADRRAERKLRLDMLKLKLAADERKDEADRALEERKT